MLIAVIVGAAVLAAMILTATAAWILYRRSKKTISTTASHESEDNADEWIPVELALGINADVSQAYPPSAAFEHAPKSSTAATIQPADTLANEEVYLSSSSLGEKRKQPPEVEESPSKKKKSVSNYRLERRFFAGGNFPDQILRDSPVLAGHGLDQGQNAFADFNAMNRSLRKHQTGAQQWGSFTGGVFDWGPSGATVEWSSFDSQVPVKESINSKTTIDMESARPFGPCRSLSYSSQHGELWANELNPRRHRSESPASRQINASPVRFTASHQRSGSYSSRQSEGTVKIDNSRRDSRTFDDTIQKLIDGKQLYVEERNEIEDKNDEGATPRAEAEPLAASKPEDVAEVGSQPKTVSEAEIDTEDKTRSRSVAAFKKAQIESARNIFHDSRSFSASYESGSIRSGANGSGSGVNDSGHAELTDDTEDSTTVSSAPSKLSDAEKNKLLKYPNKIEDLMRARIFQGCAIVERMLGEEEEPIASASTDTDEQRDSTGQSLSLEEGESIDSGGSSSYVSGSTEDSISRKAVGWHF